jgi:cytochrome c oxidase subunit 2
VNLPARFDHTFRVEVVVAFVVFGLVALVLVVAFLRSLAKRPASQKSSYKKTEAVYVCVLAAVATALIVFSLSENTSAQPRPAMTVDVTGFQWCWRFAYEGTPVSITADCVDGKFPTLVVPTGEPIRFEVESADVIHSMWIPYLRYKLLAYPNYVNSFETTFHQTGSWRGECAEFCGLYHYAMDFTLQAMAPTDFQAWLRTKEGPPS